MNIKSRIKKLYDAQKAQPDAAGREPILTLAQWERRYNGEDIRAEIPAHRLAEYDEFERIGAERIRLAEETYAKHNA